MVLKFINAHSRAVLLVNVVLLCDAF